MAKMKRYRVKEIAEAQYVGLSRLHLLANQMRGERPPGEKDADIAYATIAALWHDRTDRPDMYVINAVARALKVQPGDLLAPLGAELGNSLPILMAA